MLEILERDIGTWHALTSTQICDRFNVVGGIISEILESGVISLKKSGLTELEEHTKENFIWCRFADRAK